MLKAPIPANEDARIKDLQSFEILDTENEKEYDGLVEVVSQVCQSPFALVNFIDCNRQWFKAYKNMDNREADRENSFCGHAIMDNEVFVITDATRDERFYDNPNVTGGLKVRFYAGAPIVSPNGFKLGTICAFDTVPKTLTSSQIQALKTIAEQVSRLLELRQKNKQMFQAATTMINTQKQVAQMNMTERDSQSHHIAVVLQDEINHTISAVRSYVEKARKEESNAKNYLDATAVELDQLIENVNSLFNELAPPVFTADNYQSHIERLANDFKNRSGAYVQFNFKGRPGILTQEKGLMIFRLIQDLLRVASQSGSRNINLTIQAGDSFDIIFDYDAKNFLMDSQKALLQDNIANRVELLGGLIEKNRFDSGETRIHVNIPD